MPQFFQVLRCYKCLVFQIHPTKKSNKFQCKMCGEKQSIKRHYGLGTSKDCRLHVQKLNGLRGDVDRAKEEFGSESDDGCDYNAEKDESNIILPKKSKWSEYVTEQEESCIVNKPNETMYLDNKEVVLEIPKKISKRFKNPIKKKEETLNNTTIVSSLSNNSSKASSEIIVTNCYSSNICNSNKIVEDSVEPSNNTYSTSEARIKLPEISKAHKEFANNVINSVKIKEFPKNNGNSKWAKYIDSDEENNSDSCYSEENAIHLGENTENNTNALFSLCDDDELDNNLDF